MKENKQKSDNKHDLVRCTAFQRAQLFAALRVLSNVGQGAVSIHYGDTSHQSMAAVLKEPGRMGLRD